MVVSSLLSVSALLMYYSCGATACVKLPVPPADGYVRLYRFIDNGRRLEMVHITSVAGIPGAMAGFKGRLLVGVNSILRLYDLGKKKLLRKAEYRR